jgi:hypothetical protein
VSRHLVTWLQLSFFLTAWIYLNISSPSVFGLSESESVLEELVLLTLDESPPYHPLPLARLLPLEPMVMDRWMEPHPERSLHGSSSN